MAEVSSAHLLAIAALFVFTPGLQAQVVAGKFALEWYFIITLPSKTRILPPPPWTGTL